MTGCRFSLDAQGLSKVCPFLMKPSGHGNSFVAHLQSETRPIGLTGPPTVSSLRLRRLHPLLVKF